MEWKLFANLAEIAGSRRVTLDVPDDATVGDALDALFEAHPALRDSVLDEDGNLQDHINVLQNGRQVQAGDGLDEPVDADDELALFPPVSGG